jgi:hypothetical protein
MTLQRMFHFLAQIMVPVLTILSQGLIMFGQAEWGLLTNLISQPFWLYAGYKSYKLAGQIGIFIAVIFYTLISIFAFVNYSMLY